MTVLELGPAERIGGPDTALPNPAFWRGRRVLVTGHTGFKGAWVSLWLSRLGAEVWGLGLPPEDEDHSLYMLARVFDDVTSRFVNLRNREGVARAVQEANPEIVLHLAAQTHPRRALLDPSDAWETNLLGAQHLLDALTEAPSLKTALLATSDKVYAATGAARPLSECDPIGAGAPLAASKTACEILAASAAKTYFEPRGARIATARAGDVIGGGDFTIGRLAPDCVRATLGGDPALLLEPGASRPWLHVLDCLSGYLLYAERLATGDAPRTLNFGPPTKPEISVVEFAQTMLFALGAPEAFECAAEDPAAPAARRMLDAHLAERTLGWRCRLPGHAAILATAAWYRAWRAGANLRDATLAEIDRFQGGARAALESAAA